MPKVLPQYLEQRREQILDAAAACFARRGFHQTTMQHICEEASLSPGAVYRYFRSKEELIEGISIRRQQQNAGSIEEAMQQGTTLDVLNQLIEIFFTDVDAETQRATCALFLEIYTEAPRNDRIRSILQRSGNEVRQRLEDLIRQSQARGDFNASLDPEAIARVMVAVYHGFVTQKLVDPDFDVFDYVKVVQALFAGSFWLPAPVSSGTNGAAALRH
jgi:AcrR family transcriptional regulator